VSEALELIERVKPKRAVLTNLHTDPGYDTLRREVQPHIEPAYDSMQIQAE
jgi:phosphoribosyl 1,2-cyclic phosphate phosphodiesterase